MATFYLTPTNIDDLYFTLRDPITGRWTIPVLTFNPILKSPYYGEIDVLNTDPQYQNKVIDYFCTKLTEKWLFKDPIYKSLLKYFKISKSKEAGEVTLISDPDKISESNISHEDDNKYVFKYIEKYFITRRFCEKVLREYVATTRIKWYDLFHNSDTIKDLFRHKLKKLIVKTIYQLSKK